VCSTLLIQFDVDDKATYEMLEKNLDEIWDMRFPPQWKTAIRSKEELSNNLGYATGGMGEAMKALGRIGNAAIVSLVAVTFFTLLALFHAYRTRRACLRRTEAAEL
jgi:hypothetical protein